MRVDLSIAIVAMVHGTGPKPAQNVTHQQSTHFPKGSHSNHASPKNITMKGLIGNGTIINEGEFHWDSVQQGIILGAFFWGYGNNELVSFLEKLSLNFFRFVNLQWLPNFLEASWPKDTEENGH